MSDQRFNQKDWALHTVSLNLEEGTFTERWRKKTKTKFGDDEKKPKKTSPKTAKGKMKRPAAKKVDPKTTAKKKSKK